MGSSALLIIVSLGYLVLNWLTRGYLRFRLAMTSLLIAAGGIALITHLAHLV
jgi:cytochrome c oxidase subunit IV